MSPSKSVVIGLDLGTTSTKAIAMKADGTILGEHSENYPIYQPQPGWCEQDPDEIFKAVLETLRQLIRKSGIDRKAIAAVGMSAAMHSLLAVDRDYRPLTRALIWADNRSAEEAKQLRSSREGLAFYQRTGTPIHPMSPMTKLLWMKKHNPDLLRKAKKWISIKEYVIYQLFQQTLVDESIASATGLWNLRQRKWDEEILKFIGIKEEQLATLVPTTHIITGMKKEVAQIIGIDPDMPFVIGASDGVLANLGVGAIRPGSTAVTIGTSGAIRTVADKPLLDPEGRTFCYVLTERHWVAGGPSNNGGIVLSWLKEQIAPELPDYDALLQLAERVSAGADGLLFLPYLTGERAPYWNADAKGTFFGLRLDHRREHLVRATLEGILLHLRTIAASLKSLSVSIDELIATGGFVRSDLWRQMLADVFQTRVLVPSSPEASALGAGYLAYHAMGILPELESIRDQLQVVHEHQPNPADAQKYEQIYPLFVELYERLIDLFPKISRMINPN